MTRFGFGEHARMIRFVRVVRFFIVDNNYDDLDFDGTAKWTEKTLFSVVVQPDGSWKVGKFTVPY